jgi:hypothetical protein
MILPCRIFLTLQTTETNITNKKKMEAQANNKSRGLDWLLFLVSTAAVILLLMFADEWFWVALPFSLTYLVKALNAI